MMIDEGGRQRSFRQSPANVIPPEPPPRRPVMRSINDSPSAQVMSVTQLDNQKADDEKILRARNGDAGLELGVGRVIPLKQGFLYKKSNKPLSREWKKKYVTLLDDGRLTYNPNLNDYMGNVKGKEISLLRTTVKIPGRGPRGSEIPKTNPQFNGKPGSAFGSATGLVKVGTPPDTSVITNSSQASDVTASLPVNGSSPTGNNSKPDLPNLKKRPKRGDGDSFEFMVVSLDNVIWHFDSPSLEERDEWVEAIQQQIMICLQQNPSDKTKSNASDRAVVLEVRSVGGNAVCADCSAPDPSWASLNLGVLVCIECCGIHRNLGTHLSRIRSLDLDDWPPDLINIMTSIGNDMANGIWEVNTKGQSKPRPNSSREEKEKWIQSKYRLKEFLPPLPFNNVPYTQQLIDAVARQLIERTILVLAYCSPEHVSAPYSKTDTRTALHIASALANPILIQLLIWYGGNVKLVDHEGHSCLFYARSAGSAECAEILLANGCLDNPTLPRRRKVNTPGVGGEAAPNDTFNKLPSSNI